jgi:subtilisin
VKIGVRMRKSLSFIICLILCQTATSSLANNVAAAAQGPLVRVIIGFKGQPNASLVKAYGGNITFEYTIIPAIVSYLPQQYVATLRSDPRIAYVDVDVKVNILETEDQLPWGVDRVNAEEVWGGAKGAVDVTAGADAGDGTKIGIIDTGVDYKNPDLASRFNPNLLGYNFVSKNADPMDDHGHGTHCAGIIAASDNDYGLIGVAPHVTLYALKALNSQGAGYESTIISAIQWCINNNMNIISMSLGSTSAMPDLQTACDAAYAHGILVVAAAGNSGKSGSTADTVTYPAKYNESVISVGAIAANSSRASWSSTGPTLELAAPGVDINSTVLGNAYALHSGTSMACPHAVGAAALVWAAFPGWNNTQVRQRLDATATDLGTKGRDPAYGYGLINALAAVNVTQPTPSKPPVAVPGGPYFGVEDKPVTFDASRSYDPNGNSLTYKWNFGDGNTTIVKTATTTHTYTTGIPGVDKTYTVSLAVNNGIVYSSTVNTTATITGVEVPPIANAGGPYLGVTNQTVTFNASKSSSEEGIASYSWDFGDGATATFAVPTATHVYTKAGNYSVTLVVTDTYGGKGTDKTFAEVTNTPTVIGAYVTISMTRIDSKSGSWTTSRVTVTVDVIDDFYRLPIGNATVYGHWSGAGIGSLTRTTDAEGEAGLMYIKITNAPKGAGTFTFTVDKIVKNGKTLSLTGQTSKSI